MAKEPTVEELQVALAKSQEETKIATAKAEQAILDAKEAEENIGVDKKGVIYLEVRVKGVDESGGRTTFKFNSSGKTVEEVLENLDFPDKLVSLATIEVRKDGKQTEVTLPPHKVARLFYDKEPYDLAIITEAL